MCRHLHGEQENILQRGILGGNTVQGFCCGELYATYSHIQNLETDTEVQSRFTPDFEVMRDIRVSMATSMTCFDNRTDEIAIGDEGDDFHDTTASQNSDEIVLEPSCRQRWNHETRDDDHVSRTRQVSSLPSIH